MSNVVVMLLMLGLLLMMLVAPFSALALVMLILLGSAISSTVWQIVRTLVKGDA